MLGLCFICQPKLKAFVSTLVKGADVLASSPILGGIGNSVPRRDHATSVTPAFDNFNAYIYFFLLWLCPTWVAGVA